MTFSYSRRVAPHLFRTAFRGSCSNLTHNGPITYGGGRRRFGASCDDDWPPRSIVCPSEPNSPTSSRNSVSPSAARRRSGRSLTAPVGPVSRSGAVGCSATRSVRSMRRLRASTSIRKPKDSGMGGEGWVAPRHGEQGHLACPPALVLTRIQLDNRVNHRPNG